MVVHSFNPSRGRWISEFPDLQMEFRDSQSCCTEKPCLEKQPKVYKQIYFKVTLVFGRNSVKL